MSEIYLSIIWHMHQPCYEDPKTGEFILPWVRLHCIKDYLDMLLITEEFPGLFITFNFVPSLLEQIDGYTKGKTDRFYHISQLKAQGMTEEEKLFVISNFFLCNPPTMILPHKRYAQLFYKRGARTDSYSLEDISSNFTEQDITDIIVWFNLVWMDPLHIKNDAFLTGLIQKQRDFTYQEQTVLLQKHMDIIKRIIPSYKKALEEKRIEISTSPYFHPILPLLCDTDIAKISDPDTKLPNIRFKHPEDAEWHIREALCSHQKYFNSQPQGLWPSEGSVSEEALNIISSSGIKWVATDEIILERSTGNRLKSEERNCIYKFSNLNMFFRDHILSDRIGFVYSKWEAKDAVLDFTHVLKQSKPCIATIVLDGENAWEYYKNDGEDFLRTLYKTISSDSKIKPVTPSMYLQNFEENARSLSHIVPGSWVDGTFKIWIGHSEKNKSWELLYKAREDVFSKTNDSEILKHIYTAEGSDWNWWYGDDNQTLNKLEFDRLFRAYLISAYEKASLNVPPQLHIPIKRPKTPPGKFPMYKIHPKLDGLDTDYFEWADAGYIYPDFGAMQRTEKIIKKVWYGFNDVFLYFRVDFEDVQHCDELMFLFPDTKTQISIILDKKGKINVSDERIIEAYFDKVLEVSIKLEYIQTMDENLHWAVSCKKQGKEILRLPEFDVYTTPAHSKTFDEKTGVV